MSSKHTRKQIRCRACGDHPEPGTQCSACLVIGVEPESQELQRIIWLLLDRAFHRGTVLDLSKIPLDWMLDRISYPNSPHLINLRAGLVTDSLPGAVQPSSGNQNGPSTKPMMNKQNEEPPSETTSESPAPSPTPTPEPAPTTETPAPTNP